MFEEMNNCIELQVAELNLACKVEFCVCMETEELTKINGPDCIRLGEQWLRFILDRLKFSSSPKKNSEKL